MWEWAAINILDIKHGKVGNWARITISNIRKKFKEGES